MYPQILLNTWAVSVAATVMAGGLSVRVCRDGVDPDNGPMYHHPAGIFRAIDGGPLLSDTPLHRRAGLEPARLAGKAASSFNQIWRAAIGATVGQYPAIPSIDNPIPRTGVHRLVMALFEGSGRFFVMIASGS